MIIVYLIIGICPLLAISLMFWHIYLIGKNKNLFQHDINYNKSYISLRTRGSVRQGMGKIKSVKEYYELEKYIKFPKKYF